MVEINLMNYGDLKFNESEVPTFYQWSGYSKDLDEFKKYNFLTLNTNDHQVYVCSSENGVGLCDYISRFVLKNSIIFETEAVLGAGIDYWFLRAWEQAEPSYEEQGWFKDIIDLFMHDGSIVKVAGENADYFCLVDFTQLENGNTRKDYSEQIERICRSALIEYFQECLDREEYSEEEIGRIRENNPGPWSKNLFDHMINSGLME